MQMPDFLSRIQLTPQQHGFELRGSSYTQNEKKNVNVSGPAQFKPVLFEGHLNLRVKKIYKKQL